MSTPFIPAWEDDPNAELPDGPGERLRIARQTQGLTQERVAGELSLSPAIIEDLERDDYSILRDDVFIIGYIRKYARLVGLKPEPLVAAYHAAARGRVDTTPHTGFQIDSRHLKTGLVSLGVLILLGALVFLWQQSRQSDPGGQTSAADATRTRAPVPALETIPGPRMPLLPTDTDLIAVKEEEQSLLPETDMPAPTHAGLPVPPDSRQPPTERVDAGSATADTITATRPPATDPGPEATQEAEKTAETTATEAGEIEIIFDGSCWTDVRDSKEQYQLSGIKKKGDRYVLEDVPPYSFKLGNPAVVRIIVDGKPFDLSTAPRTQRWGTRFTLDPAQLP